MPIEIPKCSSPEGYEQYARNVEAQKVADWEESEYIGVDTVTTCDACPPRTTRDLNAHRVVSQVILSAAGDAMTKATSLRASLETSRPDAVRRLEESVRGLEKGRERLARAGIVV